ncbi:hypothetical protein PVAP13_5NG508986 [Panicum virgatum]|uniref:Uncharacterized protein n=1 Tax=Panicum virgatum TaxID=38727 RepID=A0A8T0S0Z9_PANVG|nr:hypothetical protein PVAP13_5NG508986 [Panicum virgatum]
MNCARKSRNAPRNPRIASAGRNPRLTLRKWSTEASSQRRRRRTMGSSEAAEASSGTGGGRHSLRPAPQPRAWRRDRAQGGSTSSCPPGSGRGGRDHRPDRHRQGPPSSPAGRGSRDASMSAQESPTYTGSGRTPCRPDLASSKTAVGIRPPPDAAARAMASGGGLRAGGGGGGRGAGESGGGAPGRLVADLGLDAAAFSSLVPPPRSPPPVVVPPGRRAQHR